MPRIPCFRGPKCDWGVREFTDIVDDKILMGIYSLTVMWFRAIQLAIRPAQSNPNNTFIDLGPPLLYGNIYDRPKLYPSTRRVSSGKRLRKPGETAEFLSDGRTSIALASNGDRPDFRLVVRRA